MHASAHAHSHARKYWANFTAVGRRWCIGPFSSRAAAVCAALEHNPSPQARSLYTGYGAGGYLAAVWHDNVLRAPLVAPEQELDHDL
jgi:hypothetical protein